MPIDNELENCHISRREVIRSAEMLMLESRELAGDRALRAIDFSFVYEEILYPKFEVNLIEHISLEPDEDGEKILGKYDPVSNDLFLDPSLRDDPRRVFTIWHEVGHVVLHGDWLRRFAKLKSRSVLINTTAVSLSSNARKAMEIQANLFASHAAAPTWKLVDAFERVFKTRYLDYDGPGEFSFCTIWGTQLRHASSFPEYCWLAAGYVLRYFNGLSQEALGYRIQSSGLIRHRNSDGLALHRVATRSPSSQKPAMAFR